MTPTEKLLAEQEKIVAERGYYIRPVRMANLMKAASRIFDILTKADTAISYEECRIVVCSDSKRPCFRKPPDPYRNIWPLCLVFRRPQIDTIFQARFL